MKNKALTNVTTTIDSLSMDTVNESHISNDETEIEPVAENHIKSHVWHQNGISATSKENKDELFYGTNSKHLKFLYDDINKM